MRINTKGFTLIELLAVIVILAVIALIATPIIMNVINDAKEGANGDAALGYAKAVETSIATQMIKCPSMTVGTIAVDTIAITNCGTVTSIPINYKGTKPNSATVTYDSTTDLAGKLTGYVTFGTKKFSVETGKVTS